jgi:hypothetical protein
MPVSNLRRPMTEAYEPKQRIVGGIVLFLIVLLIYSILKLVLGISSASTEKYGLTTPLGEEISGLELSENPTGSPPETTSHSRTRTNRIMLPQKFVFLDIAGKPMQAESFQTVVPSADIYSNAEDGKTWFVQAASFKNEEQAQQLVQKIKDKNIAQANVFRTANGWFSVRLPPQADRNVAEQQRKQLNNLFRLKAEVKKID